MKAIKFLFILSFITISNLNNDLEAQEYYEYYYFAHAKDYKTNTLYITPVIYKKTSLGCTFTDSAISVQFTDYLEAEFTGMFVDSSGNELFIGGAWGGKESTKARATKSMRELMKLYDKIIRVKDFEFLCE